MGIDAKPGRMVSLLPRKKIGEGSSGVTLKHRIENANVSPEPGPSDRSIAEPGGVDSAFTGCNDSIDWQ